MDLIQNLGPLAFASRLKRLADILQRDVSRIYKDQHLDFEARWFPVMYALTQKQSMAITELARKLNMTHPAINQISMAMGKKGLIDSRRGKADERQRFISLSAKGVKLARELKPIWREIKIATDDLVKSIGGDFFDALSGIEKQLDNNSMYARINSKFKAINYENIEIVGYKPAYKKYFKQLNYQWLNEYFNIESHDEEILSNPHTNIIKPGGVILFARLEKKVIGTVAAKPINADIFELSKLAVSAKFRRIQAGRKLVESIIETVKSGGARKIILVTSPKLTAANSLYSSLGFNLAEDEFDLLTNLKRKSYCMELVFKPGR